MRSGLVTCLLILTNALVFGQATMSWVLVDSMANAFGAASNAVRPLSYDPISDVMTLIHRAHYAYGVGSGQPWWNRSISGGTTWTRVGELCSPGVEVRYPTATIWNPHGGTEPGIVLAAGHIDFPTGGCVLFGLSTITPGICWTECTGSWWTPTLWAGPDSAALFWAQRLSPPSQAYYLWCPSFAGVPPTWTSGNFQSMGLNIGGAHRNGISYFSVWGVFSSPDPVVPDGNIGYSKSTDNGLTWSSWNRPQPDWRITNIGPFVWWEYGGPGLYSFDFLVDANNRSHFFGVVEDSTTLERGIVEIYESTTGWGGNVVTLDLKESTNLTYGMINQMGNHLNAAISQDGTEMGLVWLDANAQGDSLPDIWFSHRSINGNWSPPENLTQTPGYAELLLHAAPTLMTGSASQVIILGHCYEAGTTLYPPDETSPTNFYVGTHTFPIVSVPEDGELPQAFRLEPNYPNPFNPATSISYELPDASNVSLKVFDVLGREVATLENEMKAPGRHTVSWDASDRASGVYFYKLVAGWHKSTKKMLLMK